MLFDASALIDLEPALGLANTTVFLQYYGKVGGNGSERLGDLQGFSNIDADDFRGIGEAWIQVQAMDERVRLKGGRIDANSEFAGLHSTGEFLNSSMGFSPTIWGMPSYPEPGAGLLAAFAPGSGVETSVAVFRKGTGDEGEWGAVGPAWLWLGQARAQWTARGALDGSVSAGVWHHVGDVRRFDGQTQSGATGPFFAFEQTVWRERGGKAGDEGSRHLHVFGQYGVANALVSDLTRHVGVGLAVRGLLPQRRGDMAGIGVSRVTRTHRRDGEPAGVETLVGPFYRFELTEWLTITSDTQWLRQHWAGGRQAVMSTCRIEVAY